MNFIGIVLFVAFIIVCVLIVLLVLVQDDGQNGMGGLLGGRGTAAFGSHSANVLTKTTGVLVALFFVLALLLALLNKKPASVTDLNETTVISEESEDSPAATENTEEVSDSSKWYLE